MTVATIRSQRAGRLLALATISAMLAVLLPAGQVATVLGAASVTAATGGAAIAADTAADAPSPAWTTLVGPQITEGAPADLVSGGTVLLTAPSGFEFKPATGSAVEGGLGCNIVLGAQTITSASVSLVITTQSSVACDVSWAGLQVRPTVGSLGGATQKTGNITNTGNTGPGGSTNYGTLTEVPGAAAKPKRAGRAKPPKTAAAAAKPSRKPTKGGRK